MALQDKSIGKAIRDKGPQDKPWKLADGGGLYLLVTPSGGTLWRLKYRFDGKEKSLSIGAYPDVGLAAARVKRDEAKAFLRDGIDPGEGRKAVKVANAIEAAKAIDFRTAYAAVIAAPSFAKLSPATQKNYRSGFRYCKALHDMPMRAITGADIVAMFQQLLSEGFAPGTVRRVAKMVLLAVIDHGILAEIIDRNPMDKVRSARFKIKGAATPQPAIIDPDVIGDLLRKIATYPAQGGSRDLLKLMAYLFPRPTELRLAKWDEIDLDAALWTVPAERMKGQGRDKPHYVPLPTQAVAILRERQARAGANPWVFPGRCPSRPISHRSYGQAIIAMGFGGIHTAHGFRSTASSRLAASRQWSVDAIELQLDHKIGSGTAEPTVGRVTNNVRAIYMREPMMAERARMLQWYADYLDGLRDGDPAGNVVQIGRAA